MSSRRTLRRPAPGQGGFTMLELVFALFITTLVLLAAWTMFAAAGDQQLAGWREAERRSEVAAAERVLAAALAGAGEGMPSSANLGGVHVARAGAASDTLYTLQGDGPRLRVAARGCSAPGAVCLLVLGDHRRELSAGATVLVGSAGAGLQLMRVADAPAAFSAACGPDCLERILCAITAAEASDAPAVAGSVVQPPAPAAPVPSAEPCVQPVLPDGTTCTENETTVPVTPLSPERCSLTGPLASYTELHLTPAGTTWGLPVPQVAPARLGGANGSPAPLLQAVRVARFWVRASDSTLVRQSDPSSAGWGSTQPVAAHVVSMTAELLHAGGSGWTRGLALPDWFLDHGSYNSNYVRPVLPGDSAPRAWRFRFGYHTVAAVRVTLGILRPDGPDAWTVESRQLVVATPAVRDGARGEGGS